MYGEDGAGGWRFAGCYEIWQVVGDEVVGFAGLTQVQPKPGTTTPYFSRFSAKQNGLPSGSSMRIQVAPTSLIGLSSTRFAPLSMARLASASMSSEHTSKWMRVFDVTGSGTR